MSRSRWASCFLTSVGLVLGSCRSHPSVQIVGDSTRLARGEPSPAKSAIFDGRVVDLRGARGETLGFSVRISDQQSRRISLTLPPPAQVKSFGVGFLEVREPSSQLFGKSLGRGAYPDVLTPTDGSVETSELAYFDVSVPEDAAPGRYEGELSIGARRVPVELQISRAKIQLWREPLVWAFYLPKEIARVHGLADDDSPALIAKERAYHDLFRAHGVLLASDLRPSRFVPRKELVRDVRYWPVKVDTSTEETIRADVQRWLELFRGSGVIPFAIPIDEPRQIEAKLRARRIAETMGSAGGVRPAFLRGVTDAASPVYGDSIDVFISPANLPGKQLERAHLGERFWTYNGRPPQAGSLILDTDGLALRTWGWIAERYSVELWYAWEALYFSDRYNRGGPTDVLRDPLTFDERRRGGEDWGNGDGVLAYPGPLPSLRLKALRRGLADRLLLRELERCGQADLARSITRRIIPRALAEANGSQSWPDSEVEWEGARREVLTAIEEHCHAG